MCHSWRTGKRKIISVLFFCDEMANPEDEKVILIIKSEKIKKRKSHPPPDLNLKVFLFTSGMVPTISYIVV